MDLRQTLTALSAGIAQGRVHWTKAPQGTPLPYVIYHLLPGARGYHNQGESGANEYRLQCDVFGNTALEATLGMELLIKTLSGYRGFGIQGIFFATPRDMTDQDADEVNDIARVSCDATIRF